MAITVGKLLCRGDEVCIELGRLVIRPASGKPIPQNWLQDHASGLIQEILNTLGIESYEYRDYKTGHYGKDKLPGVYLQFRSVVANSSAYTIFNADLTRSRTTKTGKAGSPLPHGHFRVGELSHFYNFWIETGLAVPKSLTSFHDYMGKLRGILLTAEMTANRQNRLISGSIRPMSVSAEQVRIVFFSDKLQTKAGQAPDNLRTTLPDKHFAQALEPRGFQPKSTTCHESHGKTAIRECECKGADLSLPQRKIPQEQSSEEWLEDYSRGQLSPTPGRPISKGAAQRPSVVSPDWRAPDRPLR